MGIFILAFWIFGAISVGYAAGQVGRDEGSWGMLSIILSPLFTAILLIAAGPYQAGIEQKMLRTKKHKICPRCSETVKSQATICRHCGNFFDADG